MTDIHRAARPLAVALSITLAFGLSHTAHAGAIGVSFVSNLIFGTAVQGDGPLTISPGTMETAANASFRVTGGTNRTFFIILPAGSIDLTTGGGGVNRTIQVGTFQSYPAEGPNGYLGPSGQQIIYIGATRGALAPAQVPGQYSGTFSITVVY